LGRFISRDPLGEKGGLNLYGYVGNDPVNGVDPSGLFLENPEAAVGLAIFTAALAGGSEIANAPGPCDKTYASQGPVPLVIGTATGVAAGLVAQKVVAPFLGSVLGRFIGSSAAKGGTAVGTRLANGLIAGDGPGAALNSAAIRGLGR
jgi:hypothetical protein